MADCLAPGVDYVLLLLVVAVATMGLANASIPGRTWKSPFPAFSSTERD